MGVVTLIPLRTVGMARRDTLSVPALALAAGLALGAGQALASEAGTSAWVTAARAAAIALQRVPGGTVVDVDPGSQEGRAVWEVLVRRPDNSGLELYINATTGVVLRQERESLPREALGPGPVVTVQQAIATATAAASGGRVIAIDLDTENGRTVWEVDMAGSGGRRTISIDAATGRILKQEPAD
jgi:uncharacterized membrane protein YkoI